jgi:hypothetical protein
MVTPINPAALMLTATLTDFNFNWHRIHSKGQI